MDFEKNRISFIDVCRGNFGRKVIYSSADEINEKNIVEELGKALATHWQNRREVNYLDRYYRGDQPILYREKTVRPEINNRTVENHALEIVRFMTAQNFGEPVQYVSRKDDEKITKMVDELNDLMSTIDKSAYDIELGEWQSICGTAYRFVWVEGVSESPFEINTLNPRDVFIVYSNRNGNKPLMSVQQIRTINGGNRYVCYTEKYYYEIENSKIDNFKTKANGFFKIPVIEYPNNSRRLSDIEIVITMLDTINKIQANRMDGIEQFVQAFMKFVNCDIDSDQFLEMCHLGAIKVKAQQGIQADVSMITSELKQDQTQIAKDDVYKNILIIEGMPNREQNTGGDTGQAVYLRNGWDFAEQRAKLDEPIFIRSEKQFLKIALYTLNTLEDSNIKLKLSDIDVKITRNKTDNMMVKAQALTYLLEKGIHPKIAIKTCDLWGDPEKVYVQSKEYLEAKYKTAKELQDEQDKLFAQNLKISESNKSAEGGGKNE